MARRILLLGLMSGLAVTLGFVTFRPQQAVEVIRHCGYWAIATICTLFFYQIGITLREAWPGWKAAVRNWPVIVFLLGAALLLHVHERHEFKIVADEVVLSSTAMQMHFEREASTVLRGYDYVGNFEPMTTFVDKRPLFFPFLVSILHDVTGYRVGNVFVLNGLVTFALLGSLYLVGFQLGGKWAGIAAVTALCTVPLVAQNAVSGGFEMLNLAMIVLTLWLGLRYADSPSARRLSVFVLSGVLLTQTRYESALFVLPVALTVVYVWWRERRPEITWTVIFAPLMMVLTPLQHSVFKVSEASWQLNDIAGATSPFGLQYFYDNVGHALNFFLTINGTQPSAWLLALMGVFAAGFLTLMLFQRGGEIFRSEPSVAVVSIFLIALILHTLLMMCYFWGRWDDVLIRRLSLPSHLLMIGALLLVWPHMVAHSHRWRFLTGIMGVYLVVFTIPISAQHRYTQENFAARSTNWVGEHIRSMQGKSILAIDNSSGLQWFLYRHACINPLMFSTRTEAFVYHFRRRSFDECLVVQRAGLDLENNIRFLSADDDLGPGVELQLIEEKSFSPNYLMRLSRIVAIDEEKLREWAKGRSAQREATANAAKTISSPGSMQDPAATEALLDWIRKLP